MTNDLNVDCKRNKDSVTQELGDYWTRERMLAAEPAGPMVISDEEFENLTTEGVTLVQPPGTVQTVQSYSAEIERLGTAERADIAVRPFSDGGKLFFTDSEGRDKWGSAQFVGSRRVLMTAAHCLHDPDTRQWNDNFVFVRGYNNGQGQIVGWSSVSIYREWYSGGSPDPRYDYGFIYTSSQSERGYMGMKTNIPYDVWTSIGYPGNFGQGEYMYKVVGDKDTVQNGIVQMKNNPFGPGASGGAWIGDVTSGHGGNFAVGLNSFIQESNPGSMYGPLFTSDTADLFEYVKLGGCS